MITSDTLCLCEQDTFSGTAGYNFSILPLGGYLYSKITGNRCQPRDRNANLLSVAKNGNVAIAGKVIIIPLLEFYHNLLITANSVKFIQGKL